MKNQPTDLGVICVGSCRALTSNSIKYIIGVKNRGLGEWRSRLGLLLASAFVASLEEFFLVAAHYLSRRNSRIPACCSKAWRRRSARWLMNRLKPRLTFFNQTPLCSS